MRLTDCFIDVMAYVAYFLKSVPSQEPSYEETKGDIQRLMAESEQRSRQGDISPDDYDSGRFAVCAWVDEAILGSQWTYKNQWQAEQLQRIYYQTTDAGEIFFDRLNELGPHQRDVREVYYLCLAMGLSGRYCNEGDEFLLGQLRTSNLKLLTGSATSVSTLEKAELFPEAYPVEDEAGKVSSGAMRFSGFTLLCLGAPVVLFLLLFIIYRFILGNVGETILTG